MQVQLDHANSQLADTTRQIELEPEISEVVISSYRRKKSVSKRDADLFRME